MSRVARIEVPVFPHHITQRGNRKMDVFETDEDRLAYLRFLRKYAAHYNLPVYAYCLMTNHIHLVAVPGDELAVGKALRDAHTVYAMYFNTRTALSGHVWQGRFYSCPLDEAHVWAAVRYVERNPACLGFQVFPDRVRLDGNSRTRYRRKLKAAYASLVAGAMSQAEFSARILALAAHTEHASSVGFRRDVLHGFGYRPRARTA